MVVVCPNCQQYFEVDEVYFQQGIPVPCPTCQGALVPYQAPAAPQADAAPSGAAPADAAPADAPPAVTPEPPAPAVGIAPDQGLPSPPAPEATASAPAWSSGDLLWSGSRPPEPPPAPPEVTAAAEPPPPSPAAIDTAPAESPPLTPSAPADAQPPAASADVSTKVETPPGRPVSSWEEVGQLSWGAPPPLAEGTSPAAAFSSPDVVPPQAPAPGAWGPAQSPGAQLPTAPVAAWAEVDPGLPPPPPPAPEPMQEAPVGAVSAPEIVPEAAPVEAWGAAPSAPPQAPVAAEPLAPAAPAPVDVVPFVPSPPVEPSVPGPSGSGADKDWADAAAAWAASGFAADKMPKFVRQRQSEPPPAASSTPGAPATLLTGADLAPELPPESLVSAPAAAPPPPVVAPTPPFVAAAPVPPPLKPPSKPEIILPSPGVPPPLSGRAASTYVMKGSGEGRSSDAPWTKDSVPPPAGQPQPVRMVLPSIPPEPLPAPAATPSLPARRGGHPVLWTVLVLLLLGGGAFAGWWFFLGGKDRFLGGGERTDAPDAGVATPAAEPASPAEEIAPTPPDAGPEPDEEKPPKVVEPVAPPKPEPPKVPPRGDVPKPPKPDRPVAAVDRKARAAEAVEFYKKGNEAVKKAQYQEAVRNYQKALELDPALSVAHRGLGISFAQLRRNQDACREYRLYQKSLPANSKELPALQQILKDCK